jgi:hypothetical protein
MRLVPPTFFNANPFTRNYARSTNQPNRLRLVPPTFWDEMTACIFHSFRCYNLNNELVAFRAVDCYTEKG